VRKNQCGREMLKKKTLQLEERPWSSDPHRVKTNGKLQKRGDQLLTRGGKEKSTRKHVTLAAIGGEKTKKQKNRREKV